MLVTDDSETVKQKLIEEFPKLKECGGFEFLRCMPNCRNLKILECNWDASSLRSAVGSQAKIYVRPIQRNLPIEVNHNQPTEDLCEKCNGCSQMINIRLLREHLQNCVSETTDVVHLNDGTINTTYISSIPRDEPTMEQPTTSHVSTFVLLPETSVEELQSFDYVVQSQMDTTENQIRQLNSAAIIHLETATNETEENETKSESGSATENVSTLVNQCVDLCKKDDISNPVTILQILQEKLVIGRPLEINEETEATGINGETNFILVDRNSIVETAFSEIKDITDLRKCLEVQFYGEAAADYGGPRREFFSLILPELKKGFFDPIREWSKDYETIGKIMALSTLQNGRLPRLMSEDVLQEVFISDSPRPFAQDLRKGLDSLGLIQLTKALPTFIHLFAPHQTTPLTLKMMVNLLQPKFSEEGSNRRVLESTVYSRFVKYMREAASGRRGTVTLASLLRFVTGTEEKPVLGFSLKPTVHFNYGHSFLPTANTCINKLTLIIPQQMEDIPADDVLFGFFDYSFSNTYFGLQ